MELTQSLRKLIRSLHKASGRREAGLFMAQGDKCVADTIGCFTPQYLLATAAWQEQNPEAALRHAGIMVTVPAREMDRLSTLDNPPQVIAVYNMPAPPENLPDASNRLILALDGVQDPGNLGTIVRVANWMGVRHILASKDTADVYSPKVVQATMGSISRVAVHYVSLPQVLCQYKAQGVPVYGTFLDGNNIYGEALSAAGVVVMGNEGHGISPEVGELVNRRLFIPPYPADTLPAESLNVATATSIVLSQFRMRQIMCHGKD